MFYSLLFKNTGENYAGGVLFPNQVHHRPRLRVKLHRKLLHHGYSPAGWGGGDRMGGASVRDKVDAGWLRDLFA